MMAIGGSCAITTPGPMGERSAENEILRPSRVCWGLQRETRQWVQLGKPEALIQEWDIEYTFSQRTDPLDDGSKDRD